ncbi:MAG: endonuclease III [Treponema sp.]|nr:endonuclease III [Treponema sp.]
MKKLNPSEIQEIFTRLRAANPDPKPELEFSNAFTLLVAVVLSAQATDKSVNLATKDLFSVADTPEKMAALGEEGLIPYIRSIGLYKNKAKHVIGLSQKLISDFNSQVPQSKEDLMSLPGVGQKTANVVQNVYFKMPTMPVDTHIFRVSHKLGLSDGSTPNKVEEDLLKKVPEEFAYHAHHWLLLHGRYTCTARNPKCENCPLADICKKNM